MNTPKNDLLVILSTTRTLVLDFYPPPLAAIDDPLERVVTLALLIDLDAFDSNITQMAELAKKYQVTLRPHAKAHKSGPPHEDFLEITFSSTESSHPHIFLNPFIDCLSCFADCNKLSATCLNIATT